MSTLDEIFEELSDELVKAIEVSDEVGAIDDEIVDAVISLNEALAVPEEDDEGEYEGGPVYKAIEALAKNEQTLAETVEALVERIEALEGRGAVRKSVSGQDGVGNRRQIDDGDLAKFDDSWDNAISQMVNGARISIDAG